jgi:Regulated-SNARE-like domain
MPLMYAFVARGQSVLCEYAAYQGNFSKVAAECLAKCPAHNAKFTYNADKHTFNFVVHNGYTFLAVADEEFGRQIPFGFLEKVKEDFLKNYGETAKNAVAGSLNRVYGCVAPAPGRCTRAAGVGRRTRGGHGALIRALHAAPTPLTPPTHACHQARAEAVHGVRHGAPGGDQ